MVFLSARDGSDYTTVLHLNLLNSTFLYSCSVDAVHLPHKLNMFLRVEKFTSITEHWALLEVNCIS